MDLIQYLWLIIYLCALMALFTYGMNCWFLMLMYRLNYPKAAQRHQQIKDTFYQNVPSRQWPHVTIQLPIYNERYVVERLIESVCRIDYPKNLLEVQVLDDSTDDTVQIARAMVAKMKTDGIDIVYVHRADRAGFKAGALKEGLKTAKGSLVAVFDADFIPDPDFLMESVPYFQDPQVGMLQTRWGHINSDYSMLTRAQSIGIDGHFGVEQASRSWSGFFMNFNGTAGVWRKKTIEDAGGWQADTLTEDLDLSYRCALAGMRGHYLPDVRVLNELPGHMRAFKLQQRRWAKGSAQCLRKLTSQVMRAGDLVESKWDEAFMLAGYAIHPVLLLSLVLWPWAVLYVDRRLFWVLQGLMSLSIAAAALSLFITIRERDDRLGFSSIREVVAGLCVGTGLMVNNTVGQLQGLFVSGGEFVRTPKLTHVHEDETLGALGADRAYVSPLHWTFFLEIAVMLYSVAGAAMRVSAGQGFWSVAMVFWAACMGLTIQQQPVTRTA